MLDKLKLSMKITAVIAVISYILLGARIVYVAFFADRSTTVIIPDNVIGSADGTGPQYEAFYLTLGEENKPENVNYAYGNMFPGDTYTRYYCINVGYSKPAKLQFYVDNIRYTKELASVLEIRVSTLGADGSETLLYDGSFIDSYMKKLETVTVPENGSAYAYYKVEVTLPTSADNSVQRATLSADFNWYAESDEVILPSDPAQTVPAPLVNEPDYPIWPWCILPVLSVLTLGGLAAAYRYMLAKGKNNSEEGKNEN